VENRDFPEFKWMEGGRQKEAEDGDEVGGEIASLEGLAQNREANM
jgi:hypothetical protein